MADAPPPHATEPAESLAGRDRRLAWFVILASAVITAASVYLATTGLRINTDPLDLLSDELPARQAQHRYAELFPDNAAPLLLVIEAPTPEHAHAAADAVAEGLAGRAAVRSVHRPDADAFLESQGLLFRDVAALEALAQRLGASLPLVVALRSDPSLPQLSGLLQRVLTFTGDRPPAAINAALGRLAEAFDAHARGEEGAMSWQEFLAGEGAATPASDTASATAHRGLVAVDPEVDFTQWRSSAEAIEAVRQAAEAALDRAGFDQARVRVTGSTALAAEEKQTLLRSLEIIGPLTLVLVSLVLVIALRSGPVLVATVAAVVIGLVWTAGFAAIAVGQLNLISIAFAILYVGLGADFAIHFALRYRTELRACGNCHDAISRTERRKLGTLTMCAITTALGFLAFVPTAYEGVSELGVIAGGGMVISLVVTMAVIPAMLTLLPRAKQVPPPRPTPGVMKALLRLPVTRPGTVLIGAAVLTVASGGLITQLRFNPDPLDLRDPDSEAVRALKDLAADPQLGRGRITAMAADADAATALRERLKADPTIEGVITLASFVPSNQSEKLEIIDRLRATVRSATGPRLADVSPPQAYPVEARLDALAGLRDRLAAIDTPAAGRLGDALRDTLDRLRGMSPEDREASLETLRQRLLSALPLALARLDRVLEPREVSLATLPESLSKRWVSPSGVWRLEATPAEAYASIDAMRPAIEAVKAAAGAASVTGAAVLQIASAEAVVQAFQRAVTLAIAGIALVVIVRLRDLLMTAAVLIPLLVGGLLTGAFMVLIGMPLNFANVIALPLLLGVGVDNGIHMVQRRAHGMPGHGNLLETTTARAVLFSSLTTMCSFGNLAVSPHPGMASMGIVLTAGVVIMLLCTLVLLPAFFARKHLKDVKAAARTPAAP